MTASKKLSCCHYPYFLKGCLGAKPSEVLVCMTPTVRPTFGFKTSMGAPARALLHSEDMLPYLPFPKLTISQMQTIHFPSPNPMQTHDMIYFFPMPKG